MPFFLYVLAAHTEVQINEGLDWGSGGGEGAGRGEVYQKSFIIKILAL